MWTFQNVENKPPNHYLAMIIIYKIANSKREKECTLPFWNITSCGIVAFSKDSKYILIFFLPLFVCYLFYSTCSRQQCFSSGVLK